MCTHAMSVHAREHSAGSKPDDETVMKFQASFLNPAMASEYDRDTPRPLQSSPRRSEEALSGHTVCEPSPEQPLERQPPASNTRAPQNPAKAEFPELHKLSTLATLTFVLACVTVPCCVAFIGFLWSNPNGIQNNETWFKIVLNGWTLRSITISTMVLRVAVSAQAG